MAVQPFGTAIIAIVLLLVIPLGASAAGWTAPLAVIIPYAAFTLFLVGFVVAQQGAIQLRSVGADVFVINLIGRSTARELGILLTAIAAVLLNLFFNGARGDTAAAIEAAKTAEAH